MLNRKIFYLLMFFMSLACLDLSHAQTPSPTTGAEQTLNSVLNSVKPPTGANPSNLSLGEIGQPGKYEEYQSICRSNDYDKIVSYPVELKKKRITFLKNKIQNETKESAKIELRLLKEYINQHDTASQKTLVITLKEKKLSTFNNELLNAMIAFAAGNYNGARDILNGQLKADPKNLEALTFLAEVYQILGSPAGRGPRP